MRGMVLLPPLLTSLSVCAVLGLVLGGSFWTWLILGWISAAPLTLVWAMWGTRTVKERNRRRESHAYGR